MATSLLHRYSELIFHYPFAILSLSIVFSIFLPLTVLYFNPVQLDTNPEAGFETRGTYYSSQRSTWENLSGTLQIGNRVNFMNKSRVKRSWADDLINAFGEVPCYESPVPGMDYLSQFVLEVDSYDDIFDFDYLKELCSLHFVLKKELYPFESFTPYRNIWSISNYISCISPNYLANCSYLTRDDIYVVKSIIDDCRAYRDKIISCRKDCLDCGPCLNLPPNCSSQMVFDLFYRVLPKDLNTRPLYINAFLPVFTFSGYHFRGFYNVSVDAFQELEEGLRKYARNTSSFQLKGLSMDVKRNLLFEGAKRDSLIACGAAICIILIVVLYSLNFIFCLAVSCVLAMSVLSALAVYSLFASNFPLLNLVIFVLLLAIGSDDAFVLLNSFPSEITIDGIHKCLSHTAGAMLLTSSSTAVPFFANIFSSVVVFRCFGLFAGLTLVFNYILEITFLPALLIAQGKYMKCCISWKTYPKLRYLMRDLLPVVVISGRYVWICSLSIITVIAGYVSYNDLSFPQYNPLQLFVNSNMHEWYDNHAEKLFEFIQNKIAIRIAIRLVWGIASVESSGAFEIAKRLDIKYDPNFGLNTTQKIGKLARELELYRNFDFIRHNDQFWPERYMNWSSTIDCAPSIICCNRLSAYYNETLTDYCIRISTSFLYTQYNDTLIYDNSTFELVGYTALLPTTIPYSHKYKNLSRAFNQIDESFGKISGGWYTTEWSLMCVWYDLLRSILSDCRQSLLLSFIFVAFIALIHLRLKSPAALITIISIVLVSVACVVSIGWVIGVLEAVILVLVVGLSFDFTLHYGASVPENGCAKHRIHTALKKSAIPVALAALSSIIAGISMLFAETHAFHQVGVFLVVSASVSWLFATFFFLPLLSLSLSFTKSCKQCQKLTTSHYSGVIKSTYM